MSYQRIKKEVNESQKFNARSSQGERKRSTEGDQTVDTIEVEYRVIED